MEGKIPNSQVVDLTNEPCPMNLVKFKYHFYEFSSKKQSFTVLAKNNQNIINFLEFKKASFVFEKSGESTIFKINFQ